MIKETVDIDTLLTSRNVGRKIVQPIRITSGPVTRMRNGTSLIMSDEYLLK